LLISLLHYNRKCAISDDLSASLSLSPLAEEAFTGGTADSVFFAMQAFGLMMPFFPAGGIMALIEDESPSLLGSSHLNGVTFAKFGTPCKTGPRAGQSDFATTVNNEAVHAALPMYTKNIELVDVDPQNLVKFPSPKSTKLVMFVTCSCPYFLELEETGSAFFVHEWSVIICLFLPCTRRLNCVLTWTVTLYAPPHSS
jgi:hypothetical protein